MHPILFEIPLGSGLKIYSYGAMAALGFLAALFWICLQARRQNLPPAKMLDLAFLMMMAALVGSRLAFIFVEIGYYLKHPLDVLKIWEGGFVFYGGLIACIPTAWVYLSKHKLNFWKVADLFMPGVALGHAFGRVGCFLAGCCYGKTCSSRAWYAVVFPQISGSMAPPGIALIPTQLIEAICNLGLFLLLAWKSFKKGFDGQILLLYLIGYSLLRITIEFFRGDSERGLLIPGILSISQLIGVILIIVAFIVLYYLSQNKKEGL